MAPVIPLPPEDSFTMVVSIIMPDGCTGQASVIVGTHDMLDDLDHPGWVSIPALVIKKAITLLRRRKVL